jgi:hypothetical protein
MVATTQSAAPATPLWLELTVLVSIKLALLALCWWIWFSTPLAPHMHIPPEAVAAHLLGDARADANTGAQAQ